MAKKDTVTVRPVDTTPKAFELMLVLSPELRESEVKKKLKEVTDFIEKAGGKITNEDAWGKRTLTYRIKAHSEGNYTVLNLEMGGNHVAELREMLRIEKDLLRSLLISLPADYTYTKYDMDAKPEKPVRSRPGDSRSKNVSIKHSAPTKTVAKKEEKVEDKGKEADKAELDKKLDQMIEGDDLNL